MTASVERGIWENYSVLVMVPAYNEAANLADTVADIRRFAEKADILVIDDGSSDDTAAAAVSLGCRLLRLPFNVGIGGAIQTGCRYALKNNYDFAAQFDGDGQHDGRSLPNLLAAAAAGRGDLIIGSRHLEANDYKTPPARRWGMRLFSLIVSTIIRQKITDSTSGYRVMNKKVIAFCADNYPADYPEVEVLPLLHFAGLRIVEVPALMRRRQGGKSSINWSRAAYYMVKVILAIAVTLLREIPIRRKEVV